MRAVQRGERPELFSETHISTLHGEHDGGRSSDTGITARDDGLFADELAVSPQPLLRFHLIMPRRPGVNRPCRQPCSVQSCRGPLAQLPARV
jgi:hypothetical protein